MGWLRAVIRVGALWLLSIVVTVAAMELAHRMILAGERGMTAHAVRRDAPAVSFRDEREGVSLETLDLQGSDALHCIQDAREVVTMHGRRCAHFEQHANGTVAASFVFFLRYHRHFLAEGFDNG